MTRPPVPRRRRGWFKRSLIIALAGVVILAGLLVGGVRLLDHFVPGYHDALGNRIGQRIHARVSVSGLELGWGWHGPILYLDDPRITRPGQSQPALRADKLGLEFSLTDLFSGSRLPDGLIVDGLDARLVQTDHGVTLAHWGPSTGQPMDWSRIQAVRRQLAHLHIRGGRLAIAANALPGGQMQWSDLNLAIDSRDRETLTASLSAHGPAWWPSLKARSRVVGPLDRPRRARFSLQAGHIRALALARGDSAIASKLRGGRLSFDLNGHWNDDRLTDTQLTLDSEPLARVGGDRPLVPAFNAVFDANSTSGAHRIDIALAHLTGGPATWQTLAANAHIDTDDRAVTAQAQHLPGALALRIARLARPELADTDIQGAIDALALAWQPGHPTTAHVDFHGLRVDDPRIAFGPVAGRYTQKGDQHTLQFEGASGTVAAARYIKGQVDVTDLGGQINWQKSGPHGWSVSLDKLRLASRQAHVTASGDVQLPGADQAPVLDIDADVVAPHIARLLAHIPQAEGLPNPRLRDWLPKAIRRGSLDHGHVQVKGPMNRFPFAQGKNGDGFHMTLTGHGVDVRYKPEWPEVTDAKGTLKLDGDTLALDLDGAKMLGVPIDSAQAHVADVREPVMHLTGKAAGAPATKLMAFLSQSPLRDKFGKLVKAIDITGPADLGVTLRVPLKPGLGDLTVDGRIDAKGDTLKQQALPGPITGIRGRLAFTDHGVSANRLTGDLLGVPISAKLASASGGGQRITARARARLPEDRKALAHYLPDPWLVYGQGAAPLTVAFTVGRDGKVSPIQVTSDLDGMAIRLPEPLTKKASAQAPLAVTIDPDSGHIDAEYDHRLKLAVRLDDHGQPQRIQALLGDTDLEPPQHNGLWIGGHADQVDGLGWFHVVRHVLYGAATDLPGAAATSQADPDDKHENAASTSSLAFLGGDLTIGRLNFGDRYIQSPHVRAQPMSDTTGWRVDFEGNDSQGQITWAQPADHSTRIEGNLKRVALHTQDAEPMASSGQTAGTNDSSVLWPDLSPADLPSLQLFIQNFVVDDTSFGQMHVDARHTADGWSMDRFRLAGGALTGQATAHWQQDSGVSQAKAQADFDGHGLARLLRSVGYVSPIRAKQATVKANLSLQPNAQGLDLRYLDGQVHLALDHGTLLTVEPGPGRLLGLFNLYVLPRRLRLDFRDVVDKGMAFDKVRADFDIHQGQAYSRQSRITTPSTKIGITGRIGLATRDYDEHVTITPKVGSGVAIASAVIGGPIVGAAVFAVQQLLKQPIQHFSSVGYNLKGSWDDPQIVNPSAAQANDAKHDDNTAKSDKSRNSH